MYSIKLSSPTRVVTIEILADFVCIPGGLVCFYVDHTKGQFGVSPFGSKLPFFQNEGKEDGEGCGVCIFWI